MAIRSLLVVLVSVYSCVSSERVEDGKDVTRHSDVVAGQPEFYTCCLTSISNKQGTVAIHHDGLKSTVGRKCLSIATVQPQGCRDDSGNPDEGKCVQTCLEELKKYPSYHEAMIADFQKNVVEVAQKELTVVQDALTKRQAEQTALAEKISDLEGQLADVRSQLESKDAEVKDAEASKDATAAELSEKTAEVESLQGAKDALDPHPVPEPCANSETCCCNINHVPIRVPTKTFANWDMCGTPAKYVQPSWTFGSQCGWMKDCSVCRKAICNGGSMKGIC